MLKIDLHRYASLFILVFSLFLPALSYSEEVTIDVTKQKLTKIKTCVQDFTATGQRNDALSQKLTQTLISDFTLVDYFEPLKTNTGASLLFKGTYNLSGTNLTLEGKVFETQKGQMIFGKRVSGAAGQYKQLIHKLTDSIVEEITGEKGIAQTRLTFEGSVNGRKQIFVSDFDGGNLAQVTKDPCPNLFPTYSPGGEKIVYTSYLYNFPQTFVYNVKTGKRDRICGYPGLNTSANFSPDGGKIALTLSKDGNPEIYTIDSDGSGLTRITNDKAVDTSPCWSPDGKKIAFVSNRGGNPQVYIVSSSGGAAKRITYSGSYNTNPSWSPEGDIIVYNTLAGGTFQVCIVDIGTGQSEQVTQSPNSCENPSFAREGRHVVFSMTKGYNGVLCIMDVRAFRQIHTLEIKNASFTNPDWGR